MGNFRELLVWQKAKELAVKIYKLVNKTQSFSKDFGDRRCARQAWQGILTLDRLITFKRFGRLTEE
mgnify:CR=1 FL=1